MPLLRVARSKWQRIKKTNPADIINQWVYFEEGVTDSNGEFTFTYSLPTPAFLPSIYPSVALTPPSDPKRFPVITDLQDISDTEGQITITAYEWDTAVIGSDTVLLESVTPVPDVYMVCVVVVEVNLV